MLSDNRHEEDKKCCINCLDADYLVSFSFFLSRFETKDFLVSIFGSFNIFPCIDLSLSEIIAILMTHL